MNILRLPPYPLSVTYTVPSASTDYVILIKDSDRDIVRIEEVVESNAGSTVTLELPEYFSKYDESYHLEIYEAVYVTGQTDPNLGDIVVEDNLNIERPYIDPSSLGTTASEIKEYEGYESLARAIIDSVTGGFYYETSYIETVGQGTDYMPLWEKAYKVLKVYENAELVYDVDNEDGPALGDWNYLITKDKTAITKDPVAAVDAMNRSERKPARMALAASDSIFMFDTEDSGNTMTVQPGVVFGQGVDYIFLLETGYRVVPIDIQDATSMLINDIKCGKLDYYKRFVTSYSTDQYRLQFDKGLFDGTGNLLVDKILEKYITNIGKPGVL
jgi:hypothetical protein